MYYVSIWIGWVQKMVLFAVIKIQIFGNFSECHNFKYSIYADIVGGSKNVQNCADVIYEWSPIPTSSLSSWRAKAVLSLVTASKDACRSNSFWPRSPASDIVVCCCASSRLARRLLTSYGFPKKKQGHGQTHIPITYSTFLLFKAGVSFLFYTLELVSM